MEKTKPFRMLNPRLGANFKAIFTQDSEDSRKALKSFLTAAIGRKVESVTVVNNDEPRQYDPQRSISYDINCTFDDGEKAQIEMQSRDEGYEYGKRAEYYAARLVSSVVDVGDDWDKVPQVYQISVLNFTFDHTNKNPVHHYIMCDKSDGAKLNERLNVIFMELTKLPATKNVEDIRNLPTVLKWCKFLKEADNPKKQDLISELVKEEDGLMAAEKTLNKINMDEWRWIIQGQIEGRKRDYTSGLLAAERRGIAKGRASGLAEGHASGLAEGEARGAQQNAIANARKALNIGLTPNQVVQITSLPLEQVLSLKEELEIES